MAIDTIQINALTAVQVRAYYNDHLAHFEENRLRDVAFILDFEISRFSRTERSVQFRMSHNGTTVEVGIERGWNMIEIAPIHSRGRRGKNVAFGGRSSFADAVMLFRSFYCRSVEITMQSPAKLAVYPREQWFEVVLLANQIVNDL